MTGSPAAWASRTSTPRSSTRLSTTSTCRCSPTRWSVAHAQANDYYLVAYSPLGRGNALDLPAVETVAEKHDVSPAQACLAWVTHPDNVVAVPKATGTDHLADNLAAGDVDLDAEDVERIEAVEERERFVDREGAPWK